MSPPACDLASELLSPPGVTGSSVNAHWPMRDRAVTWADQSELAQPPLVTRCQWAASQRPYVCVKIFRSQSDSPETELCLLVLMKSLSSWVQRISRHSQSVRASYLRVRASVLSCPGWQVMTLMNDNKPHCDHPQLSCHRPSENWFVSLFTLGLYMYDVVLVSVRPSFI